jgi:hypothetical protein
MMSSFRLVVFNDSLGRSKSNITGATIVVITKITATYSINLRNGREYDDNILKGIIDSCNVQKGTVGNFFIKMIMDTLDDKYTNYKFECPQPIKEYYVTDFPILDTKYVPRFLANMYKSGDWELTTVARAKAKGSKVMVHLFSTKIYGGYTPPN